MSSILKVNTPIPCNGCAEAIIRTLRPVKDVRTIACDLEKSQVIIEAEESCTNLDVLKATVIETLLKSGRKVF